MNQGKRLLLSYYLGVYLRISALDRLSLLVQLVKSLNQLLIWYGSVPTIQLQHIKSLSVHHNVNTPE